MLPQPPRASSGRLDLFKKTAFTQKGMRFLQRGAQLSVARRARHLVMSLVQTGRCAAAADKTLHRECKTIFGTA